jgi:hypothetical protein
MKALFVILSALMLCSCGGADREKRLSQLEQSLTEARDEVTRIEFDMREMAPGPAKEVQALKLKTAKAKVVEAKAALNKARVE